MRAEWPALLATKVVAALSIRQIPVISLHFVIKARQLRTDNATSPNVENSASNPHSEVMLNARRHTGHEFQEHD